MPAAPNDRVRWKVRAMVIPLSVALAGDAQSGKPVLRVSDNGHFLVDSHGAQVFLVGDTAWRVVAELTREEMDVYLDKDRQGRRTECRRTPLAKEARYMS